MTTEKKAIKIIQELVEESNFLGSYELAAEKIKTKYKLTSKQFAGMLILAFN